MKNFKKIAIGLILLMLLMGIVSAVTVDDFKYPNTFTKSSTGDGYVNDLGQGMIVFEYDDASKQMFLTEHDNYMFQYYEDNMYIFSDGETDLVGLFEVVEFKGEKFIVLSTILSEDIETDTADSYYNMMDFNELNNVEALSV